MVKTLDTWGREFDGSSPGPAVSLVSGAWGVATVYVL